MEIKPSDLLALEENVFKVHDYMYACICKYIILVYIILVHVQVYTYMILTPFQLLNKFERGTYAKRLSKVYQSEFKETPPENLLELAKAMPFVRTEK